MPEFLQYDFMIRALVAGLLVAVVVPVLGSFLVARRQLAAQSSRFGLGGGGFHDFR